MVDSEGAFLNRKATDRQRAATAPSRGRGRPTLEQAKAISKRILAIGRAMFFERGYSATSMEAIAAEAGMSKGTLYSRFPQKADLFAAIVEDSVKAWTLRTARKRRRRPKSLRGVIEYHVLVSLEAMADPEILSFAELLTAERRRFPELARIYHERALMLEIDLLTQDIEDAAAEEAIPIASPSDMAFAVIEATWGWANIRSFADPRNVPAQRVAAARRIASIMIDGLDAWK